MPPVVSDEEPSARGRLEVGGGHVLAWEAWGQPEGTPAVVLHGGPGSGCAPGMRQFFDLDRYRVVLFDQRGCGESTPHAADSVPDAGSNTTAHLIEDLERLSQHLGFDRWLVLGMSWGSTLGLAYAECNPERVAGLVLVGVTTTRQSEIEWLYRGVAPLFPAQWEHFRAGVPAGEEDGDLVAAYHRLLFDPDPAVHQPAALAWSAWDLAVSSIDEAATPDARWSDARFRLARARLCTHYFTHRAWLEDGVLLREANRLAGIPGVMIHGRYDLASPLATAWELDRAWPDGELVVMPRAGHSVGDAGMSGAVADATRRFA